MPGCGGGYAAYAGLDDDGKLRQVAPVGSTATFTRHHTARHATGNRQSFTGGRKITEFAGSTTRLAADLRRQVALGGRTGRQKVLAAVRSVPDTAGASSCADVGVGGTSEGRDTDSGDAVFCGGHAWRTEWSVTGDKPGAGEWGVRADPRVRPA
ncbi:hypothetical protein [Streptomyces sp. NPDC000134]|uniref:hypothetical protein n=1 Tax=Streptomyces sp. NPDC000134 TaxID=3364536 RepID=UPI003699E1C1